MSRRFCLGIFLVGIFLFSFFGFSFVKASSSGIMNVTAHVSALEVGITVPNNLSFDNITCGYWQRQNITITNTGNVNITVTPTLENYSGELFNNLGFNENSPGLPKSDSTPSGFKIGNYSFGMDKPYPIGSTVSKKLYVYLDLTKYPLSKCLNKVNESFQVTFTAVPA